MILKIRASRKPILQTLLSISERDTRSRTGSNLRKIMLMAEKSDINEITFSDIDMLPYHALEDSEWRLEYLEHLLHEREVRGLDNEELEWLKYLCCD